MSSVNIKFLFAAKLEEERSRLVELLRPGAGEALLEDGPMLSTRDVALLLRVSPATIRRWADAGKLVAWRSLGGHRMFPLASVRRALEMIMVNQDGLGDPGSS